MKYQYDMLQTNMKFQRDLKYKVLKEDIRKHLYNFDMKQKGKFDTYCSFYDKKHREQN